MKKLTILLITILIIYLIYYFYQPTRINYASIGNYSSFNADIKKTLSTNNFNDYFNNSTIVGMYNDINNNRTIKVNNEIYYIKKVLRESDVLVINIGMDELNHYFNKYDMNNNYVCFNKMYSDIEKLIKEVRKYAYGKIIFIGYYNHTNYYDANIDRFFYDVNIKLERLMIDNNIIYIDLYEYVKGNNKIDSINKRILNTIEFYLK